MLTPQQAIEDERNGKFKSIEDIYRWGIDRLRETRATLERELAQNPNGPRAHEYHGAIALATDEISHKEIHLRRLETDHAECVTPCCPACKMRGRQ